MATAPPIVPHSPLLQGRVLLGLGLIVFVLFDLMWFKAKSGRRSTTCVCSLPPCLVRAANRARGKQWALGYVACLSPISVFLQFKTLARARYSEAAVWETQDA